MNDNENKNKNKKSAAQMIEELPHCLPWLPFAFIYIMPLVGVFFYFTIPYEEGDEELKFMVENINIMALLLMPLIIRMPHSRWFVKKVFTYTRFPYKPRYNACMSVILVFFLRCLFLMFCSVLSAMMGAVIHHRSLVFCSLIAMVMGVFTVPYKSKMIQCAELLLQELDEDDKKD